MQIKFQNKFSKNGNLIIVYKIYSLYIQILQSSKHSIVSKAIWVLQVLILFPFQNNFNIAITLKFIHNYYVTIVSRLFANFIAELS